MRNFVKILILLLLPLLLIAAGALAETPEVVCVNGTPDSAYAGGRVTFFFGRVWEGIHYRILNEDNQVAAEDWTYQASQLVWYPRSGGTFRLYASGLENGGWSDLELVRTISVDPVPEVSGLTVLAPESVPRGMTFNVLIRVPEEAGTLLFSLYGDGYSSSFGPDSVSGDGTRTCLFMSENMKPGLYRTKAVWTDGNGAEHVKTGSLRILGASASRDLSLELGSAGVAAGNSFRLSGWAGGADLLVCSVSGEGSDGLPFGETHVRAAASEGRWSMDVPAPVGGRYQFTVTGYTAEGYFCGRVSATAWAHDALSPAAPVVTLEPIEWDPTGVRMSFSSPRQESGLGWHWVWTAENGEIVSSGSRAGVSGAYADYSGNAWFSFRGTYTLTVTCSVGGAFSIPVRKTFTVSEGPVRPVNGRLPLGLEVPETWPEGEDLVLNWTPVAEGQTLSASLISTWFPCFSEKSLGTLTAPGRITVPGYLLRAGDDSLCLSFRTSAASWESTVSGRYISIQERPGQPEAPSLEIGEAYAGIPLSLSLGETYEDVFLRVTGSSEIGTWQKSGLENVVIPKPGTYLLSISGKKGGIWSRETRLPLEVRELIPVSEITALSLPDSLRIGEDLPFRIQFPSTNIGVTLRLCAEPSGEALLELRTRLRAGYIWSDTVPGWELINRGVPAGSCSLRVYVGGSETPAARFPLSFTGAVPAAPTLEEAPSSATVGGEVLLAGRVGDADTVLIRKTFRPGDGTVSVETLEAVSENGTWSCSFTPGVSGLYELEIIGRAGDLYTGSLTWQLVATDSASLPAPLLSVEAGEDNCVVVCTLPESLPEGAEVTWFPSIAWLHAGGKWAGSGVSPTEADGTYWHRVNPESEYTDTFTFSAFYLLNGQYSQSASLEQELEMELPWPENGPVPIPVTVPSVLPAGVPFVFDWEPLPEVDGVQYLEVSLRRSRSAGEGVASSGLWSCRLAEAGVCEIPGWLLNPGSYTLEFYGVAETYASTRIMRSFTVTENPDRPAAPALSILPESPSSADALLVLLDRTCEQVYLEILEQGAGNVWNRIAELQAGDTDSVSLASVYFRGGSWKIAASVRENGVWSPAAARTFEVRSAPKLAAPVLAEPIPEITMYLPFTVRLTPVAHATGYYGVLQHVDGADAQGNPLTSPVATVYLPLAAPASGTVELNFRDWAEEVPGGEFILHLEAEAADYETSSADFRDFTVREVTLPEAPTAQLCHPDGTPLSGEEKYQIPFGFVPVSLHHADSFTEAQLRIRRESDEEARTIPAYPETGSSDLLIPDVIRLEQDDVYTLSARVKVGDFWSRWSEPAGFAMVPLPSLEEPALSADKDAPSIGEGLRITVSGIDSNAETLVLSTEEDRVEYSAPPESLTLELPEGAFRSGENRITATVSGTGYQERSAILTVLFSGERPDAPEVSLSALSGSYGDVIRARVTAPGATLVQLGATLGSQDGACWPLSEGAAEIPLRLDFYSNAMQSGAFRFRALTEGIWSAWTEYISVETSEISTLPDPDFVILPEAIVPGEDLPFTFLSIDGVDRYSLEIKRYEVSVWSDAWTAPGEVRLPAPLFRDGGAYTFILHAGPEGAPNLLTRTLELTSRPFSGGAPLSVSAEKTELAFGEPAVLSLGSLRVSRILVRHLSADGGLFSQEILYSEDSTEVSSFTLAFAGSGEKTIRVSAMTGGVWTAWSDPLTFTVAPRETSLLANPTPQVSADTLGGKPIRVSWSGIDSAERYRVHLICLDRGRSWSFDTAELSLDIPAEGLPAGDYQLYVESFAAGYRNDGQAPRISFVLKQDPAQGLTRVLTLPAGTLTLEPEALAGTLAQRIILPASCASVGSRAFASSPFLTEVIVKGADTVIAADAFEGCGMLVLRIPAGSPAEETFQDDPRILLRNTD